MRGYDDGYGGGYDSGYGGPRPPTRQGRSRSGGRGRYDQDHGYTRPWTGGYREGYQGGSGGIRTGAAGPSRRSTGGDDWWLGNHNHPSRQGRQEYDARYRAFDRANRPRFSPVGGMHAAMSGRAMVGRPPRELRDPRWFSEWTRWF